MGPNIDRVREWIDITQQQFDVFKVIYQLGKRGTKVTILNIEDEYLLEFNLKLQRPNLHSVLRVLLSKGIITRSSRGEYRINYRGITLLLNKSETDMKEKLYGLRKFKSEYVENMKNLPISSQIPVTVLDYPTYYEILSKILLTADRYYCMNRFPGICYTHLLSNAIKRGQYGGVLTERCLVKKELKITYLSYLDIGGPFYQAMNVYKNIEAAYKECLLIINQLENQIQNTETLELRCLEQPSEWYTQFVFPEDVFIMIKIGGETKIILHLKSEDVGKHAYSIFQEKIKYSERVTPDNIGRYIGRIKTDLKKIVADYRSKKSAKEKLSYEGM
jgi:hypothetical protein